MNLQKLVSFARLQSPFYKDLYQGLPKVLPDDETELLSLLPFVDSSDFWKANTLKDNQVLTGPMNDGIVFKSGGTSGSPKFSVFTKSEWNLFCESFGRGLVAGGLKDNEKVANLFYVGELYASFIFIMKSFENATSKSLHLPIAGSTEISQMVKTLIELEATTIAATPSTLIQICEYVIQSNLQVPSLQRMLFGGESLYKDQKTKLQEIFPDVAIQSIGYASVDAGLLGYIDQTCRDDEHRSFGKETIYEIIDIETNEPIQELGKVGKAYVTYLDRSLMPIIRYPVGDLAMWTEEKGAHSDRRFKLIGRSDEAARVGPVSIYYDDLQSIFTGEFAISGLQIVLKHFDHKDQLVLRIDPNLKSINPSLFLERLYSERTMLKTEMMKNNIHPSIIEFCEFSDLKRNARTGKLIRVIDERKLAQT